MNRQRLRPARQPAPYNGFEDRDTFANENEADDDDAPHFREIPEKESSDFEVGIVSYANLEMPIWVFDPDPCSLKNI